MERYGPLQLIVIDFRSAVLPPLVHAQVDELRKRGFIRLVDSVVAAKSDGSQLIILDTLDAPRGDPSQAGVLARAFFGTPNWPAWNDGWMGGRSSPIRPDPELSVTEEQLLEIADLIPTNSRALILLIEHLWASELDIAAMEAEGHVLANCWVSPTLIQKMMGSQRPLFK
jgi:hypothetical protein